MKFILTKELGRLAKWLRILGFDAVYFTGDNFGSLIIEALRDERIILTRNHHFGLPRGIKILLIQSEKFKEQLKEVLTSLNIKLDSDRMFTRCIICNQKLVEIEKTEIKDRVPEYVYKTQEDFFTCPNCRRIYWSGSHWGNVTSTLEEISFL